MNTVVIPMGTFHVDVTIENYRDSARREVVDHLLVDTGSDYTWVPGEVLERLGIERQKTNLAFTMANGQQITRSIGFAIIRTDSFFTIDEVVFGEPSCVRPAVQGFNARVDSEQKRLVAAGPILAASNPRITT